MIRPAANANYFPSNWTFELDHEAVLQRLIYDAYERPEDFIRELIQNALDANRCQMYADLVSQSIAPPEYPTQVAEEIRARYPVSVSLRWVEIQNQLSQETERRQVLIVSDRGIGMDKEIIQRYFLQVGRSFYTTDEFRRTFRFIPTSRFGIGFLSTFAVSDRVEVETFKPSSPAQDGPIRLVLTGPRNYLLTERSNRRTNGTDIEVLLREPMEPGQLSQQISVWCRRVEFPIFADDLGISSSIIAETPEQFVWDIQDVTEESARLIVRAFPVDRPGIEGELYVFAKVNEQGEAWDQFLWVRSQYPLLHPGAATPEFPNYLTCLHGIAMEPDFRDFDGSSSRVDYRGEGPAVTLSRTGQSRNEADPALVDRWEEILSEHLATSSFSIAEDGWKYRQRLVDRFFFESFWTSVDGMIPVNIDEEMVVLSLEAVERLPALTFVLTRGRVQSRYRYRGFEAKPPDLPQIKVETPTLLHDRFLSDFHGLTLISPRVPTKIHWLDEHHLAIELSMPEMNYEPFAVRGLSTFYLIDLPVNHILRMRYRMVQVQSVDHTKL